MSETAPQKPNLSRKYARRAKVAAWVSGLAPVGIFAPAAEAQIIQAGHAEAAPSHLVNPNKLPGHNLKLSPETAEAIKNATVAIDSRQGVDENYNEGCNGVYLGMQNGKAIIRSAAHCFADVIGNEYGTFKVPGERALDYIQNTNNNYQIGSAEIADYDQRMASPMGQVEAISIDTNDNDMAILAVQPNMIQNADGSLTNPFDSLTPLNYSHDADPTFKPTPGQPVALAGVPQQNGYKLVYGTGTFLKRSKIYNQDGSTRLVDIIGIKSPNPNNDKCNFGISGGGYAADVDGKRFWGGNLTQRYNIKSDPQKLEWTDAQGNVVPLAQRIATEKASFAYIQRLTGVNLSSFDTLCEYSVPGTDTQYLLSAFGHYPPAKGGDPSAPGIGVPAKP